jgi:predicted HTH transcriptional regulator
MIEDDINSQSAKASQAKKEEAVVETVEVDIEKKSHSAKPSTDLAGSGQDASREKEEELAEDGGGGDEENKGDKIDNIADANDANEVNEIVEVETEIEVDDKEKVSEEIEIENGVTEGALLEEKLEKVEAENTKETQEEGRTVYVEKECPAVVGFLDKLKELRGQANRVRQEKKEKNLEKIITYAQEHNRIVNDEVERITGVKDARATEYLNILVKKGILVRFGKKGTYSTNR